MRNVVASIYLSLDGVMESPERWYVPYADAEAEEYGRRQLFASDALLLGRVTYQAFAGAWPNMTDETGFADRINGLPKHVASTSLSPDQAEWNASFIKGDIGDEVSQLKRQPGQDILLYGSADLVNTLLDHGLIDELRLWVTPVVVGRGKRLFPEGTERKPLTLANTTTFSSGAVVLAYQPAGH